ncbi:uncharacterized protein LOC124810322 [Hydra vulgaris]|uniref:uncharacterized protein LOC124810322 n=1 Tax=Hydra vulgaris TaxID=6087 RepID=UPI001F5EC486|nr:uncharacterized protein LOC124810322 [Hydra vulgaris]XP_047130982.1 uncharacterized protein LOC124810322 [Hydra vulgaris]XP_047130983.1 uncharacterized protein LOC124810322 [Hydra vulgaris]XP_047130984.1 uncharacterized protein LOC124810322 [Hydra vulgaris]
MQQVNHTAGSSQESKICQTSVMLKSYDKDEANEMLKKANIETMDLNVEEMVALKAEMGIPWNKLKTMARCLNSKNITTASNNKQRVVAIEWSGNDIVFLNGPFTFQNENNHDVFEIKLAPWAYIKNLPNNIENLLNLLEKFNLLYHDGIKKDEIHIKIGGDHGGGSFKMSYQIVNQNQPNSKSNSYVFSTFEAKDYRTNLKVGQSRDTQQVDEMQKMNWKNHHFCVFMFGYYDFLCSVYRITGAKGRHCCLFCGITKEEMKIILTNRIRIVSQVITLNLSRILEEF